jgi:hypothetical protein
MSCLFLGFNYYYQLQDVNVSLMNAVIKCTSLTLLGCCDAG